LNIKGLGIESSIITKMWATIVAGCLVLSYVVTIAADNSLMPVTLKSALENELLKAHVSIIFYLVVVFAIWFVALALKLSANFITSLGPVVKEFHQKAEEKKKNKFITDVLLEQVSPEEAMIFLEQSNAGNQVVSVDYIPSAFGSFYGNSDDFENIPLLHQANREGLLHFALIQQHKKIVIATLQKIAVTK
jgi:hypothetical protein